MQMKTSCFVAAILIAAKVIHCKDFNPTPVIGILSQEVSAFIERQFTGKYSSYIAASYVKFVEGGGGRVVPIFIGQPRSYYEDIMTKINGVLLPGGATFFNQSNGYADAGKHIYEIAIELNSNGTYFPLWGTCLGFELLVYLSNNGTDPRSGCYSQSQALPLEFVEGFRSSRLFSGADDQLLETFSTHPVTSNFHMYCFTLQTFANSSLDKTWNVLSLNHDWNNDEFISSVEHQKYPFYGVQFHPEKNLYEFVLNKNITHDLNSTRTSQYFAQFFVNEARQNNHQYRNSEEEASALIYNYYPEYTGALGSAFAQQYLFPKNNGAPIQQIKSLLLLISAAMTVLVIL